MHIYCDNLDEMIEAVAGLVKNGLTFKSTKKNGMWDIELTGGH